MTTSTPSFINNAGLDQLTSEDAAKELGMSRTQLIGIASRGLLHGSRTQGGHWRFRKAAVLEYKETKMRQAKGLKQIVDSSSALGLYEKEAAMLPRREKKHE